MDIATGLAGFLAEGGVRHVFGLPGTETIELMEATRRAGIDFVLTHHESTAAFAAAITGHLTGRAGVCMVAGGPGIANATTGILAAHLDRMPLCVVIGDHVAAPGLPVHQRLPFEHVAPGIVRARLSAAPDTFGDELPRAFAMANGPLPGPVLVSVSTDAAGLAMRPPATPPPHTDELRADPEARLRDVAARLSTARRVLIVLGIGVTHRAVGDRLVRLAEALGAPVTDTPQSKGWFPNDHDLYVGTIATRRNADVVGLGNRADVVLALGVDSAELLGPWPLTPPVLSVSPANAAEPAIPAEIAVDAPFPDALDALFAGVAGRAGGWPRDEVEACSGAVREGLAPPASERPGAGLWPQEVVGILREELPPDAVATTDVGSHKLLMVQQWVARTPNSFLCSTGLSPMGTGLGFAIGARLALPSRPIAAVIGDGGLLMYAGELATLRRLPGPLVVVVMRDAALSSIRVKQARRGYPATGTLIDADLRLADAARSLGLQAARAEDDRTLRDAVRQACGSDRPMVIEALVDPRGYEWSQ